MTCKENPMTTLKLAAAVSLICGLMPLLEANEVCVTTTSELRTALAAMSDGGANQDERNDIELAAGTYSTSDGLGRFVYRNTSPTSSLHLWGGFNADCSLMGEDASVTILDGNDATQVLVVRSAVGEVDVLNLTVQNANTDQPGAGIAVNDLDSTSGDVLLRNLIIRNNHTTRLYGGFRAFARGAHVLYFDNNLVVDNSADTDYGAGALFGEGQVYMRYDTVSRNTSPNTATGGVSCSGTPNCEIANSVFWLNSNTDLNLASDAKMYFDDVGILGGTVPSINDHPITGDPLFVAPASGDYHLGNGSPLLAVSTYLDSGSDNDVEGHALPLTGTTDVGAYMDTIFNDNLEPML
jgi:hypothetical protein